MRKIRPAFGFIFCFCALWIATSWLWQHRFVSLTGTAPLTLEFTPPNIQKVTLGNPVQNASGLAMRAASERPHIEYQWNQPPASNHVYIRLKASTSNLRRGREKWDDGRVALYWVDKEGQRLSDNIPISSAVGTTPEYIEEFVLPIAKANALPRLTIVNLGFDGDFYVHELTVQPIVFRVWAKPATILLIFCWGCLIVNLITLIPAPCVSLSRKLIIATTCVAFGWASSLPGPLLPYRPIGGTFPIIANAAPAPHPYTSPGFSISPPQLSPKPQHVPVWEAQPQIPRERLVEDRRIGDGVSRWLLDTFVNIKPLFHVVAFGLLSLLIASVSKSPPCALAIGMFLAGFSEFCQWSFGFKFQWSDSADLAIDFCSIYLGMIVGIRGNRLVTSFLNDTFLPRLQRKASKSDPQPGSREA